MRFGNDDAGRGKVFKKVALRYNNFSRNVQVNFDCTYFHLPANFVRFMSTNYPLVCSQHSSMKYWVLYQIVSFDLL